MADAQRPEDRLNTPGDRTGFHRRRRLRFNEESFGQFAEWIARFMGSPRFLLWMTVFVVSWIVLNLLGSWHHWDPYPFILLNLAFSTQASYSAPDPPSSEPSGGPRQGLPRRRPAGQRPVARRHGLLGARDRLAARRHR